MVENDPGHLGRLLQLILGVAINCDSKTDHIQALLTMEQDVQRVVMMAIQVLEEIWHMKLSFVKICRSWQEKEENQVLLFQLLRMMLLLLSWWRYCNNLDKQAFVWTGFRTLPEGYLIPQYYLPFKGHGEHKEWKGAACPKMPRLGNAAKPYEGGEVQLIRCILRPIPLQDFPRISFWGLIIGFPLKIQIMCYKPQFAP